MNDSQVARVLWREWASCDLNDNEYLTYLFKRVCGQRGGVCGAMVLCVVMTVCSPFALSPMCLLASWMLGVYQARDFAWMLTNATMLVAYSTMAISVLSVVAGTVLPWKVLFVLLQMSLPSALTPYFGPLLIMQEEDTYGPVFAIGSVAVVIALVFGMKALFWECALLGGVFAVSPFGVAVLIVMECKPSGVRSLCLWWWRRPHYREVERALEKLAGADLLAELAKLRKLTLNEDELSATIGELSSSSWPARWRARHSCIRFGGLAIKRLLTQPGDEGDELSVEYRVRDWVVRSICHDTVSRFRDGTFLCPQCYTHVQPRKEFGWLYYGCRQCGRSHDVIPVRRHVVCVLDQAENSVIVPSGPDLHLNCFAHPDGFDFDAVEVVNATDEQVERLVMSMANETDPFRRKLFARATCSVATTCPLSTNSLRLLNRTFRHVERIQRAGAALSQLACQ